MKIHKILPVFAFLAFILILMPLQDVYGHTNVGAPTVVSITTTSTTTLDILFTEHVDSVTADVGPQFTFNTGGTISSNDVSVGGGVDTITLTTTTAFGTGVIPTVTFVFVDVLDVDENIALAGFETASVDGVAPTMDSATVTSPTTIDVTFSEDLTAGSVIAADFTLDQSLTVSTASEDSAGVVTITTNEIIADGASPKVTLAGAVTDASPATNTSVGSPTVTAATTTVSLAGQGSGCRSDCQAPTLGVNSEGDRFVTNGFTYNGKSTDVESFFTPYPLITANVGQKNTAVFKIYENYGPQNVKHFSLAFGLGDDQIISQSKAMIELDINFAGIETVTITDPENALGDVRVRTSTGTCGGDFTTQCLIVTVDHTFRAPLDFNIVSTEVWDNERNSWQNYYNHGIEVVGESLNPPNEYFGIYQGELIHLIETGKNTAIDADGNIWTFDNIWIKDYVYIGKTDDPMTSQGYDRNHVKFNAIMQEQELFASSIMKPYYKTSFSLDPDFAEIDDIKFIKYPSKIDKKLAEEALQDKMHEEDILAQKYLMEYYATVYPHLHPSDYPIN